MSVFLPSSEQNLILTGYIPPELPQLGREVAQQLRMPFVNFESLVTERMDMPIEDIRTYFGERRLKSVEVELAEETALRRHTVIRMSGRALLHSNHLALLSPTGIVIGLTINLDAMLQRLHISMGARYHDPKERAIAIGELQHDWRVRDLQNIEKVNTTYLEPDEIIARIVSCWQELAVQRI